MIHDSLNRWRTYPGLTQHRVWATAFAWLENHAATATEGFHPLGEEGFYARVRSYPLKTRETARYEAHRQTIDVQFTVEGGEGIELAAPAELTPLHDYSAEKEVEHFATPAHGVALVENLAGRFTVLFPGEPHLPQLQIRSLTAVRKVVVKIPAALVQ
jgi:YhcH/YjgK/YiaL family protein